MASTVSVDGLADAVMDALMEYKDLTTDAVKSAVKKSSKQAKEDIISGAPRKSGRYAESWKVKTTTDTATSFGQTVYSPKRYMLAHLLEFGHAMRNGGRTRAISHIAPAEQSAIELLEQEIRRSLEG